MGTKGADVCPCSAQAWLIEVSAWRLVAAVSHGRESRGGGLSPRTPVLSAVMAMEHLSRFPGRELGLEEVPGSLPHSP